MDMQKSCCQKFKQLFFKSYNNEKKYDGQKEDNKEQQKNIPQSSNKKCENDQSDQVANSSTMNLKPQLQNMDRKKQSINRDQIELQLFEQKGCNPLKQYPNISIIRSSSHSHLSKISEKQESSNININKKIVLKISPFQSITIDADKHWQLPFKTIISCYLPNCRASFCLKIPGQKLSILRPNQPIKEIFAQQGVGNEVECTLIKPYDKDLFLEGMKDKEVIFGNLNLKLADINKIENKAKQKVEENKNKFKMRRGYMDSILQIMMGIVLYTQKDVYQKFNAEHRQLNLCEKNQFSESKFYNLSSVLTNALRELPYFVGKVYRGIKNILFGDKFKVGDLAVWNAFSSSSKNQIIGQNFIGQTNSQYGEDSCVAQVKGTAFTITSLTGRDIQYYSAREEQEVLFLPYSYFIVDKIERKSEENLEIDYVLLREMPSPEYFDKNMILYLNEEPESANQTVMKIEEDLKYGVHALQMTSIQMLDKWLYEFSEFLQWKEIKYRIIVDLKRKKRSEQVSQYCNELVEVLRRHKADTKLAVLSQIQSEKITIMKVEEDVEISDQYQIIEGSDYQKIVQFCKFNEF